MSSYQEVPGVQLARDFGQTKIRWYADGQKYAFRLSNEDFEKLAVDEGQFIPVIELRENNDE